MKYTLAKKNLLSQKSRTILTCTGITIGIASLVAMLSFSFGLKQAIFDTIVKRGPLTEVTVRPESAANTILRFIPGTTKEITPEQVRELEDLPNVSEITRQISFNNFSSLRINFMNQTFQTDAMVFGIDKNYIADDIDPDVNWDNPAEPYPAIVSRRIIDLYNLTIAPTGKFPQFNEQDLLGTEFEIIAGQSSILSSPNENAKTLRARIAGFSDKVDLIGVTLPINVVLKLNKQFGIENETFSKIYLQADSVVHVDRIMKQVEEMKLSTSSSKKEIQLLENNFQIINVGMTLIAVIILLVAGLTIANTFISSINERKQEIGLLRSLGATKKDIRQIFLTEAVLIGVTGGIAGIIFGIIGSMICDKIALSLLPGTTFRPDTLFQFSPIIFLLAMTFSVILSIIFAYIPASKAAKLDPLEALS